MNLVDPSGHTPVPHPVPGCTRYDADGFCVQGGVGNGWDTEVPLTQAGEDDGHGHKRGYGGDQVKAWYDEYNKTPGWWNNYAKGTLTLEAFIGLWALMESGGNLTIACVIATIIAQNLYVGGFNPRACNTLSCVNGAFNFMAAQSQGTGGLFSGPEANKLYAKGLLGPNGKLKMYKDEAEVANLIFNLGSKALDIGSVISLDKNKGPASWGNTKYWDDDLRYAGVHEGVINGTAKDTVYYYLGNAVYYSVAQYKYWKLTTDMTREAPGVP
jgi:hypothetical protein